MRIVVIFIVITFFILSCNIPKTASIAANNRQQEGTISMSERKFINQNLKYILGVEPKETLVVKYEFAKDICYKYTDRMLDDNIFKIIENKNKAIDIARYKNPNTTIVLLKAKGRNFSKLVQWNDSIKVDRDNLIQKALFRQAYECGSSVIIYPDNRFIKRNSDSNFEALSLL
jgi:hypothetical protein